MGWRWSDLHLRVSQILLLNPASSLFLSQMLLLKPCTSDWDLNPRGRDLNPAKTDSLPTDITHLVSGLNEAQVLDVSSQKEFSERQSVR